MSYLRNRQVRNEFLICMLISAFVVAVSFSMNPEYGIWMLVTVVVLNAVHFFYTFLRYRRIKKLAEEIDKILHMTCWACWVRDRLKFQIQIRII